jgi:hypothetical protein
VTFNNLFPVAGQLRTFEIGSGTVSFPDGGSRRAHHAPDGVDTDRRRLPHSASDRTPDFAFRARTHVTQLVLVGNPDTDSLKVDYDTTISSDPSPAFSTPGFPTDRPAKSRGFFGPTLMFDSPTPEPGDTLLFTLRYENTGTNTITGGMLIDDFDETLMGLPTNISDGGMVVDGNIIRWELPDIEPGDFGTVSYQITINSTAEFPPGSTYLFNTAILNAGSSVAATTNEVTVSNNVPVITGLNVDSIIDENGNATLTGTFSDASSSDTHTIQIDWGDGQSDTLTFSTGERNFSIEHNYDQAILSGIESFEIVVSVTDLSGQFDSGSVVTGLSNGAPPVANAGGPYTITVGGELALDASDSSDPDGDLLTFAWDLTGNGEFVDASGASPTINWQALVALGINIPGDYDVAVQVSDGSVSEVAVTTLSVLFATPTINIDWMGGSYNSGQFNASGSVLGFDDSVIGSPTFAYFVGSDTNGIPLASAPIDAGIYTVQATFAGDDLHTSASAVASIVIDRANATIVVDGATVTYDGTAYGATGSATGVLGESLAGLDLGASFTDAPGGMAQWMFTDVTGNYNDVSGSVEISVLKAAQVIFWSTPEAILEGTALSDSQLNASVSVAGPAPAGTLSYDPPVGTVLEVGFQTLTVTAAETQNYLPATASVELTVSGVSVIDGTLLIIGTNANDQVVINQIGRQQYITANFLPGWLQTKSFLHNAYDRIEVYLSGGNDMFLTTSNIRQNMLVDGGDGDDFLVSAGGDDVLIGGDGNDVLIGGQGRDLLIGGQGRDLLFASSGGDLLIGGFTAFDGNKEALLALSAEWASNRDYENRRQNLLATNQNPDQFLNRLNEDYFLIAEGDEQTVFDDGERDQLVGGVGRDWYFAGLGSEEDDEDRLWGLHDDEKVEWVAF